jgi:hypothetical protein
MQVCPFLGSSVGSQDPVEHHVVPLLQSLLFIEVVSNSLPCLLVFVCSCSLSELSFFW